MGDCGGKMTADSGTIVFQRDRMGAGKSCRWEIDVKDAESIDLAFNNVMLSKVCKQVLTVEDDSHKFQNMLLPQPIQVSGNSAVLQLITLHNANDTGFSLKYTANFPAIVKPTTTTYTTTETEGMTTITHTTVTTKARTTTTVTHVITTNSPTSTETNTSTKTTTNMPSNNTMIAVSP